jgi:hypothetical protein
MQASGLACGGLRPTRAGQQREAARVAGLVELERSLANLTKHDIGQLTALIKTWLRRMQYRPGLLDCFLAMTEVDLGNFHN